MVPAFAMSARSRSRSPAALALDSYLARTAHARLTLEASSKKVNDSPSPVSKAELLVDTYAMERATQQLKLHLEQSQVSLEVHTMDGKSAKVVVPMTCQVGTLRRQALTALGLPNEKKNERDKWDVIVGHLKWNTEKSLWTLFHHFTETPAVTLVRREKLCDPLRAR